MDPLSTSMLNDGIISYMDALKMQPGPELQYFAKTKPLPNDQFVSSQKREIVPNWKAKLMSWFKGQ